MPLRWNKRIKTRETRSVLGTGYTVICERWEDQNDKGLQPLVQKVTIVCKPGDGSVDEKIKIVEENVG